MAEANLLEHRGPHVPVVVPPEAKDHMTAIDDTGEVINNISLSDYVQPAGEEVFRQEATGNGVLKRHPDEIVPQEKNLPAFGESPLKNIKGYLYDTFISGRGHIENPKPLSNVVEARGKIIHFNKGRGKHAA